MRNYFKDETDDSLIRECLLDTFDENELGQWLDILGKKRMIKIKMMMNV